MSLETYLARRMGSAATPETPAEIQGFQPKPAQTLACTHATPETPKTATSAANDAEDLAVLLRRHGDASAGGVNWSSWALSFASASASWLVVTASGLTLLRTAAPIPKPRAYAQAWPLERIAPWPEIEDDAADAEPVAREAIQRAAAPCRDCQRLHTVPGANNRFPWCKAGHPLVYRASATRTWPGRSDAADCGDRA